MSDKSASSEEMHPALKAYLKSKNGDMEVSKVDIVQHLVQPALSMMAVVDNLDPKLKDVQLVLNNIELERLAALKKYGANPKYKGTEFTERTDITIRLAGSMIKSYFKESNASKYGEEAAEFITSQMKAMATDSAQKAMNDADLAKAVEEVSHKVSTANGSHGVGTKKGSAKGK